MNVLADNMQLVVALLAVLALIIIGAIAWRTLGPRVSGRRGQRLGISEYYEVDKSRRLVLVRRDNVEHLILIGGDADIVIEPNISAAAIAAAYTPTPVTPEPGFRPAARAPSFGERRAAVRPAEPQPQAREPEL